MQQDALVQKALGEHVYEGTSPPRRCEGDRYHTQVHPFEIQSYPASTERTREETGMGNHGVIVAAANVPWRESCAGRLRRMLVLDRHGTARCA